MKTIIRVAIGQATTAAFYAVVGRCAVAARPTSNFF